MGAPLIIATCRHILNNGRFCRAAASGNRKYCRAHLVLRVRHRNIARARRPIPAVEMPRLFDMKSVQLADKRLSLALAAGLIDPQTARLMKSAIEMSVGVLRLMDRQAYANSNLLYQIPIKTIRFNDLQEKYLVTL
jgi:hypothetical protein